MGPTISSQDLHLRISAHLTGLSSLVAELEDALSDVLNHFDDTRNPPDLKLQQLDFLRQSLADIGVLNRNLGSQINREIHCETVLSQLVLDSTKAMVSGDVAQSVCSSGELDLF